MKGFGLFLWKKGLEILRIRFDWYWRYIVTQTNEIDIPTGERGKVVK